MRKCNEKGKVIRYKVRFVAQGFMRRFGIDYTNAYSPVMDANEFSLVDSFCCSTESSYASHGCGYSLSLW